MEFVMQELRRVGQCEDGKDRRGPTPSVISSASIEYHFYARYSSTAHEEEK